MGVADLVQTVGLTQLGSALGGVAHSDRFMIVEGITRVIVREANTTPLLPMNIDAAGQALCDFSAPMVESLHRGLENQINPHVK